MKKILVLISGLSLFVAFSSNVFAHIKVHHKSPIKNYRTAENGAISDYVGVISAAVISGFQNDQTTIMIVTDKDEKNIDNDFPGLALEIDGKDLPLGFTLMNSVGKKLAVSFDENFVPTTVSVVTDKYYYGEDKTAKLKQ